jgi:Methyltransferase domain
MNLRFGGAAAASITGRARPPRSAIIAARKPARKAHFCSIDRTAYALVKQSRTGYNAARSKERSPADIRRSQSHRRLPSIVGRCADNILNEADRMGRLLEIVTPLHKATKRDYLGRMNDDKVHCMVKAKEYEFDYWDGDRRYGYGGYKFIDGRWKPVAQALIDIYGLKDGSSVLDVGCGKAFLLYEMKKILPGLKIAGFDISKHGLAEARDEIKPYLFRYRAQDRYPYGDGAFDLVISLGCLHNLRLFELETAVAEINRVGKSKYIMLEGYRNELEQFNLECWALTAESILHTSEWIWLYNHFGYTGDYEFIYFE